MATDGHSPVLAFYHRINRHEAILVKRTLVLHRLIELIMCAHFLQIIRAVYWNNFFKLRTFPFFNWGSIMCIWWNRQGRLKLQDLVCMLWSQGKRLNRHLARTFLYRTRMSWLICTTCQLVSVTLAENKMPYFHVTCQSSSCLMSCPSVPVAKLLFVQSCCLFLLIWQCNQCFYKSCYISPAPRSFRVPIWQNMIFHCAFYTIAAYLFV